ncbi:MAG: type I-B CRISPR-associated protein Cas8b1/Cst1 [Epulopiscium sp. Nele67-Bin004]|nr:MAG: type I-B CRISPR-associated protein Cas8b1/Cst1 [Epulopiscium sp. Nele67-Bin004]
MVKIELSDWLYNAGVIGLYRMLEHAGIMVNASNNSIEINEDDLDNFGDMYFEYLIDKYLEYTSYYNIISVKSDFEAYKKEEINDKQLEKLNKQIDYIKDKCKSNSYKAAYELIPHIEFDAVGESKKLTKVKFNKDKQTIQDVWDKIEENINQYVKIVEYFEQPEVKKYIVAKNVMYDIVQQFWENVSFMHKTSNKKDMYILATEDFGQTVQAYQEVSHEKDKYQCTQCCNPISKLSKPASYDLTWLKRIGVDGGRKSSHFWNYNADAIICPACRMVYACMPLGFSILRGQGLFINENSSVKALKAINELNFRDSTNIEDLEQQSYYNLINIVSQQDVRKSDKYIQNIQIVKFNSQNERRPYTFNMLSRDKIDKLSKVEKSLGFIIKVRVKDVSDKYINVYAEVIQNIYNNNNQFELISRLIYLLLKGNTKNTSVIYHVLNINNAFMGGSGKVYYKKIEESRNNGAQLRVKYIATSKENKIAGLSHKLLNALKTKNTARFTETVLNAYMHLNIAVPYVFIEALQDEERLQTLGYAFLLGLQGETKTSDNKENKGEENNG